MTAVRRRWWGLDGRQTVVLFAVAIVVGVGIALVLGRTGDGGSAESSSGAPAVARIAPGTPGSPAAVWVFGFETLRFDPTLRRAGQVALEGFGDVLGTRGAVVFFDAGTGRVGRLDARRNELKLVATVGPGANVDTAFVPTLTTRGSGLWVAPDPGRVGAVDPTTGAVAPPVVVAGTGGRATGLAGDGTRVYAATATPAGVEIARIDDDGTVAGSGTVPGATLDGFAVDSTTVWLRSGTRLLALDRDTFAVTRTVDLSSVGGLGGLVAADGSVWMLADGGATLVRYDPGRDRIVAAARLLDREPTAVEIPAALVTDGRRVAAMVQRAGADDLTVRVGVHDPASGRTVAADVPGRIAPGALALSGR